MSHLTPDLVILDVEMPELDGLQTLAQLRPAYPNTPVIMFSALTEAGASATLEALALGATDYFPKPSSVNGLEESRNVIRNRLIPAIKSLARLEPIASRSTPTVDSTVSSEANSNKTEPLPEVQILAIGVSTGGPNALLELFQSFPSDFPVPIVLVQHMPPMFTKMLAERLTTNSRIRVSEAQHGHPLVTGHALIAPGDYHLTLRKMGLKVFAELNQNPPENSCRPAVDPLFRSVASIYGSGALALVLTGMGQDGLRGCEQIRETGGQILVQDEASSVVWGMPGAVAKAGLAHKVLPLSLCGTEIVQRVMARRGGR
jgi:two-component system chemotaxis response regulator CheB